VSYGVRINGRLRSWPGPEFGPRIEIPYRYAIIKTLCSNTISGDRKRMEVDIPDKIMEKVSVFPSMPQAGIKLRALLVKEDVTAEEIEEILRRDPGLATNVLRLANSAYFGIPNKVSTLRHAVMLLGVQRFSKIAVSACMSKNMDVAVEGYGLSPGELWLHSIAVSTTAEALTKNRKLPETLTFD
jgi:HD-like signal output (HDOD) protein